MTTTMNKSYGLDAVNVSFLRSDEGNSWKSLPLVISPRWESTLPFLCSFMKNNRKWIDEMMRQYGAVLFRGFDITSSKDFEDAISSFQTNLSNIYRGTSPRRPMDGTKCVFSAAEVPSNYPIAQHLEMSFLRAPPLQLFFSCMKAPTTAGGETALCDFREVYRDLSKELREKLVTEKIRYTRTHHKTGSYFTYDVSDMLGWPEMFGTSDKVEVERICKEEGLDMSWEGPEKDTFLSVSVSEPFQHHPVTKEPVWFNHSQVFHWTTFPAELFLSFLRTYDLRLLLHCIFVSIFSVIKYVLLGHIMSLHVTFGDGTPISFREMHEIRTAIHKNMVYNRWQLGDFICIDNFSTSHGRQPTYDRNRKVVVAWSHSFNKTDTFISMEDANIASENPQERTPESTLTSEDAQELKNVAKGFASSNDLKEAISDGLMKPGKFEGVPTHNNPQETLFQETDFSENANENICNQDLSKKPVLIHSTSDFWKRVD